MTASLRHRYSSLTPINDMLEWLETNPAPRI
jgi:hypothetical protein